MGEYVCLLHQSTGVPELYKCVAINRLWSIWLSLEMYKYKARPSLITLTFNFHTSRHSLSKSQQAGWQRGKSESVVHRTNFSLRAILRPSFQTIPSFLQFFYQKICWDFIWIKCKAKIFLFVGLHCNFMNFKVRRSEKKIKIKI